MHQSHAKLEAMVEAALAGDDTLWVAMTERERELANELMAQYYEAQS